MSKNDILWLLRVSLLLCVLLLLLLLLLMSLAVSENIIYGLWKEANYHFSGFTSSLILLHCLLVSLSVSLAVFSPPQNHSIDCHVLAEVLVGFQPSFNQIPTGAL